LGKIKKPHGRALAAMRWAVLKFSMQRNGSHSRRLVAGAPFVRPLATKIFVIRERHLESSTGRKKNIRRILIFDDHPDSLRLVFGRSASSQLDLSESQPVRWWKLALVSLLTMVVLLTMFAPLL
jgi:hypothetical protein